MYDMELAKLKEYEELEKAGLMLRLRCKIGDTVWVRYMECDTPYKEEHCTDHEGSCDACPHRHPEPISKTFDYSDIPNYGTRIFRTYDEALTGKVTADAN